MTTTIEATVPYDRAELSRMTQEIETYLAELWYVDRALGYIDERHDPLWAMNADKIEHIYIDLGKTYPFTRRLTLAKPEPPHFPWQAEPESNQVAVSRDLDTFASTAQQWASTNMATFTYTIDHIIHPAVADYDVIVDTLNGVHIELVDLNNDFGQLENDLGSWKGAAAQNFADEFYNPFEGVRRRQANFVTAVAEAFVASKGIARLAQHSVMTAVATTRDALREQLKRRRDDNQGASVKDFLIIASSVTGVLAAMSFKIPPLSASLAVGSASLGFAANAIPDPAAEARRIEGTSSEELFNGLFDAVRTISSNSRESYGGLHTELQGLNTQLYGLNRENLLFPKRPLLADEVDGATFHHTSSSWRD